MLSLWVNRQLLITISCTPEGYLHQQHFNNAVVVLSQFTIKLLSSFWNCAFLLCFFSLVSCAFICEACWVYCNIYSIETLSKEPEVLGSTVKILYSLQDLHTVHWFNTQWCVSCSHSGVGSPDPPPCTSLIPPGSSTEVCLTQSCDTTRRLQFRTSASQLEFSFALPAFKPFPPTDWKFILLSP